MVGGFMLEDVKRAGMLIFKVTDPAEGDQNQRIPCSPN
jgi:hypothetical protein